MTSIESQPQQSGKLVALEGDVDTVATQLRLLPPSQKILVLPSLLENLPHEFDPQVFDARALIRDVHTTFVERTERARSFLQSSTTTQPRLVFINGGSVSARATCITKICENITNGDVREAKIIFNEIVKDGVAGLMEQEEAVEEKAKTNEEGVAREDVEEVKERSEDPSMKAMKAADSLNRETAELQEGSLQDSAMGTNEDSPIDLPEAKSEVPEVKDDLFTSAAGDDIVKTVVSIPSKAERTTEKRNTFSPGCLTSTSTSIPSASSYTVAPPQQTENESDTDCDDDYDPDLVSPGDDSLLSVPPTPGVVYGEACVVDVQSVSPEKPVRKVKSLERFYPSNSEYGEWHSGSPTVIKHAKSAYHLGRPGTSNGRVQKDQHYLGFQTLPRTTFVRASTTIIKKLPSPSGSRSSSVSTPKIRIYVDRGTDAEENVIEEEPNESAPFEPVFPVVEDLVIHFAHDTPNDIFEYVISAYKNGGYPILPPSPEPESWSVQVYPASDITEEPIIRPTSHLTAETDDEGFHRRHEFDPYADNNYPGGVNQWHLKHEVSQKESSGRNLEPPTPSLTPPPTARGPTEKFCEFSPLNLSSVIGIQNSLRALLNLHFPAGENGYTQYYFPVSPETDRLWKPVFRNDDTLSIGNEGRTVDQIIALGSEDGVKKDFFAQVSGQVEKLGMKRDGLNRSSKIDLRYFIANVMQMHSNLPLSIQRTFNPLSSPEVLAACIVPQIESYLATNTTTRLLILHFSFNHLPTIMALRKIIGQDVFKVAGIMDSLSSDPLSSVSRPSTPTATSVNPLSNEATSSKKGPPLSYTRQTTQRRGSIASHLSYLTTSSTPQPKKSESGISFSKANYLLPSTATDTEITTFLSSIWMSLMEKSTFYTPEAEPKPIVVEKPPLPPTPTTSTFTPSRDRDAHRPVSFRHNTQTRESKIARLTGNPDAGPRTPTGSKRHKYAGSVASTVRTTASERMRREDARIEKDWENFYIGDEDSEDDDYDRMVLGRAMAKIVPETRKVMPDGKAPKRSTQKALKWLGLA